ncbi:putative ribonuclease H-like domain-containing protein, partial [Tanacetum coccineum]
MVCFLRLALSSFYSSSKPCGSWVVLVVRVGSFPRGNGEVGMGRVELVWYLGGGMARKTMGEGSMRLGGKVVRVRTASSSNVFIANGHDLRNNDQYDSQIPTHEDIYDNPSDGIFTNVSYDDEGAVADFTNLETTVNVSPIPTSRIHSIHPTTQILGDPTLAVQTRSKVNKSSGTHAFVSYIQKQKRNNHKDFQHCLNKKDERGVVVRNKARLVAEGYIQEEGINYYEVFAPVARIEAIRIFLAFASYIGFIVYQMGVKSAFLYGTIDEESSYASLSTLLLKSGYRRGTIDKTLFIKKDKNDIMLVQ